MSGIDFKDMSENMQSELSNMLGSLANQIQEICDEGPVSVQAAQGLPTAILVLTVIKMPELLGQLSQSVSLIEQYGGEDEYLTVTPEQAREALKIAQDSFKIVVEELNVRVPPTLVIGDGESLS